MEKCIIEKNQLISKCNYISGAATIINLAGNFYNFDSIDFSVDGDIKAIKSDFYVIGNDLQESIEKLELEP